MLKGISGASTFDLWCQLNPGGTWLQFMASLVGAAGPQGAIGAQGPQGIPGVDAAATQQLRVTTPSTGLYTWTYPASYGAGVIPVIECCCEGPDPQNGVIVNAQVEGAPTNTAAKIRVTRSTTLVQVLGINVLSLVTPIATVVYLTARAP